MTDQLKVVLRSLESDLDTLRIGIKYLLLDLEATRRENAELRRLLEAERNKDHK